jgi:hypothetical protein
MISSGTSIVKNLRVPAGSGSATTGTSRKSMSKPMRSRVSPPPTSKVKVTEKFKELKYFNTTLDLDGYRTGSKDAVLGGQKKA